MKSIPILSQRDVKRFLAKVTVTEGCWLWAGAINPFRGGYGRFQIKNRPYSAHRVSYFYHFGIDPKGSLVCHRCDNPRCVNPGHLFLGSPLENIRDMDRKGRRKSARVRQPGELHGRAKLTNSQVAKIRRLLSGGAVQRRIAQEYGVSTATICNIAKRKNWSHIP